MTGGETRISKLRSALARHEEAAHEAWSTLGISEALWADSSRYGPTFSALVTDPLMVLISKALVRSAERVVTRTRMRLLRVEANHRLVPGGDARKPGHGEYEAV